MFYDCNTLILPDISKWKIHNINNSKHFCSVSHKEKSISSSELFPSIKDISDDISSNDSSSKNRKRETNEMPFSDRDYFYNNDNQDYYDKFYD